MFTDPDGEWAQYVIGAIIGGYTGYKIAEAKGYDLGDWQTYGYILGGAAIGGLSGVVGAEIVTAGGFMANTTAMVFSSYTYSVGMSALSLGMIQPSVNFGFGSYNFGTGEFNFLLDGNNKWYEDLGYAFGALANIQDVVAGFNGTELDVNAASTKEDWWSHSSATNSKNSKYKIDVSVGPAKNGWTGEKIHDYLNPNGGGTGWPSHAGEEGTWTIRLNNVNRNILQGITKNINTGKGIFGIGKLKWNIAGFSCVNLVSRNLWAVGIPTLPINIHPYILNLQLIIRQVGIYSSPYLYQIP